MFWKMVKMGVLSRSPQLKRNMGKYYTHYFFIQLLIVIGCFFQVQESSAQAVAIIDNGFNACFQRTTIIADGVGPIKFQYIRNGIVEGEETVTSPGADNTFTSQIFNLPPGSYQVVAVDANNTRDEQPLNVFLATTVRVNVIAANNATCSGQPSGEALIDVTSNSSFVVKLYKKDDPTVLVREFNNTENLIGLPAGAYIVEVRDAVGCVAFEEIVIEEPEPLLLAEGENLNVFNPVCDNDFGRVVTRISGGNGAEFEFDLFKDGNRYRENLWTTNNGNLDISDLEVGTYLIRIFTDRGNDINCYTDYPFEIVYTPKFNVIPTTSDISCYGLNDGEVSLVFSGTLVAPFQIRMQRNDGAIQTLTHPNIEPKVINNLHPGAYTILVKDADGCEMKREFSILEPAELSVDIEAVIDVCYDIEDGKISVKAFGGTGPFKFSLTDNFDLVEAQVSDEKTFTGLAAGTYKVFVQDKNGCPAQTSDIMVIAPTTALTSNIISKIDPNCPEMASGYLEVVGAGGWGAPFTYQWTRVGSNNVLSSNPILSDIPAGRYELQIIDKNGCVYTEIFELIDPFKPEIEVLTPSPVTCFGNTNGEIYIKLAGEEAYDIILDGITYNSTEATFTGLSAGNYTLQVKIAENCFITRSVVVGAPDPLEFLHINAIPSNILCYGDDSGSITGLQVRGGNGSYTYQWQKKNSNDGWDDLIDKSTLDVSGLTAGEYRIAVVDAKGCAQHSNTFTLTQPSRFVLESSDPQDADCYGESNGSLKLSVDGGTAPYYYSLDNGNSYTIFNNPKEALINTLPAGDYSVLVRDENNCSAGSAFIVTINQPEEIKLEDSDIDHPSCAGANDGKITAMISGGSSTVLSYAWYKEGLPNEIISTSLTIEDLEDGKYFLRVVDPASGNCVKLFDFTIAAPSAITAVVTPTNIICRDDPSGALRVGNIAGGNLDEDQDYIITWNGPNGFISIEREISGLYAGSYTLSISDGKHCELIRTYDVTEPADKLEISVETVVEPGCSGADNGRIEVLALNGVSPNYSWAKLNLVTNEFEVIPGRISRILNQGVAAGTYRVTVRDEAGCSAFKDININEPAPLTIVLAEKEDISCFEVNDGFINVDIQGGTAPYSFRWSNGQTNQNIRDLRPGIYTLEVLDGNRCPQTMNFEIKGIIKPEIREMPRTDVVCLEDEGALSISLNNGLNPADYTIYWKNLRTDEIFGTNQTTVTGLRVGSYQVFVEVQSGCTVNRILRVEGPESPLKLLVAQEDPRCPGQSGAVYLNARGGFAPYSFFIQMNNVWQELNGSIIGSLNIGDYEVKVRDARGCEDPGRLEITQPNPPSYGSDKIQDVSCFGGNDGRIDFSVTGGTHQWFRRVPGQASQPIPDSELTTLVAGTYFMEITFAEGCVESDQDIIIGQPPLLTVALTHTDPLCFGDTGSARISIVGGKDRKTVQLIDRSTNMVINSREDVFEEVFDFPDLEPGNYKFIVRDRGCSDEEHPFTINAVTKPTFDIIKSNVTCMGDNDGIIEIIDPIVNLGRTFKVNINGVDQPVGQFLFENLSPNIYTIIITDNLGCSSDSRTVTITQPERVELENVRSGDPTCFGGNDGFITFRPLGGNQIYTAVLIDRATNEEWTLTNLQEGNVYRFDQLRKANYSLEIRDGNGCLAPHNFILNEPEGFTVRTNAEIVICEGGEANLHMEFSGGSPPFTVEWRSIGGNWNQLPSPTRQLTIPGLIAGSYEYRVKDAQDCDEVRETFIIEDGETIVASATVRPVSCEGRSDGMIELSATGSRREGNLTYSFYVNDAPILGNRLMVPAGQYRVRAIIGNSQSAVCDSEEIIVIVPVVDPISIAPIIKDVSCKGGSDGEILLNLSGGNGDYRVEWTHDNRRGPELKNLRVGRYMAYVYDEKGCAQMIQIDIQEPAEVLQVTGNMVYETCTVSAENSITLDARGGTAPYTFLWSNGATTQNISDVNPGAYSVVITDAKGCIEVKEFDMPAPKSIMDIEVGGKLSLCSTNDRAEIRINVSGGSGRYTYKWNHGPTTPVISNLLPGTYRVEVKDSDGCVVTNTTIIPQPDPVRMSITELSGVSCKGLSDGSIKINISGGLAPYNITWSNGLTGVTEASNLSPDIYSIIVEDAAGCITSTSVTIREPEALTFTQIIEDSKCAGDNRGAILLTVEGGTAPYSYRWTTNQGNPANGATSRNLRNLLPGTYTVLITDRGGCTTGGTFVVSEPDPIKIEGTFSKILSCHGVDDGYINLNIDGGTQPYKIKWSDDPNNNTFNRSNLLAGIYSVEVEDENGCKAAKTFEILQPKPLVATLFSRIDIDCETRDVIGTAWVIVEGGTGAYEVRWNSGEANVREVQFNKPGDITVYVKDVNGCNIDVSRTVDFPPLFADAAFEYSVISLDSEGEILINDPIQFNDHTTGNVIAWEWDFGDGSRSYDQHPKHTYSSPGIYDIKLRVYDTYGCSTLSTIEVEVIHSYRILIPNAFTPNGDGLNDTFMPKFRGITEFEMHIFNTWGDLLYSAYSMEDPGWNGYTKNRMSQNGNYVYKVFFTTREGIRMSKSGVFLLIN